MSRPSKITRGLQDLLVAMPSQDEPLDVDAIRKACRTEIRVKDSPELREAIRNAKDMEVVFMPQSTKPPMLEVKDA